MADNDGSVTISVDLNIDDAEKELNSLKKEIEKTEAAIDKKREAQSPLVQQLDDAAKAAEEATSEIERLQEELKEAQEALDPKTTQGFNLSLEKFIEYQDAARDLPAKIKEQEAEYAKLNSQISSLSPKVEKYDNELLAAEASLNAQKQRYAGLVTEIEQASNAQAQTAEAANQRADAESRAAEAAKQTAEGEAEVADGANRVADATNRADGFLARFSHRVVGLAKRVFVFSLITSALRSMRSWLGNVIRKNEEASAAMAKLRSAVLTLAQPILNVVIPAFVYLVNVLTKIISVIASFVSTIFGTTFEASAAAAESLYDEGDAIAGVGSAAKKASKSLASFDEINQLSGDSSGGGGGGGGVSVGNAPDFQGLIADQVSAIDMFLVGTALLAIGAILTFSGVNIPIGIAMMAMGAAAIVSGVQMDWQAISTALQGPLGNVFFAVSAASLVIGAILAFSGVNIPLGIALMVLGAAGLATVAAVNWNTISEALQGPLGDIVIALSAAAIVLGAILLFTGANIPLGLGLLVIGAAGLATTLAANWDTMQDSLDEVIGLIVGILSAAALVIGAILLFTGANIPLGLGLLIVGAVELGSTIAANWDIIKEKLQGPLGKILAMLSVAFLVLGAILLFTGAAIPLALGLLVIGAATLATTIAANWNTVQEKLQGPLGAVVAIVSAALLVLGVILLFTGGAIPLGLGLIVAGAAGLAAAIAPNWGWLVATIKEKVIDPLYNAFKWLYNGVVGIVEGIINGFIGIINGFISGINMVVSAINLIPGVNLPSISKMNTVSIPRLAEGAVIPPNREFMAVLGDQKHGTNIETPLDTMVQAFRQALSEGGYGGGGQTTVILEIDREQFGKVVFNANERESRRIGVRLAET